MTERVRMGRSMARTPETVKQTGACRKRFDGIADAIRALLFHRGGSVSTRGEINGSGVLLDSSGAIKTPALFISSSTLDSQDSS
jgi:hypothetical protein